MFSRILVPLDGTVHAELALPVAARIARASGGTVVLLHVLSGPRELLPFVLPALEPSTYAADVAKAEAYLEAVAARPDLADVTVVSEVRSGIVHSTILGVAGAQGADLVVLVAGKHTGLARWLGAGISDRVERLAPIPVLTLTGANRLTEGGAVDRAAIVVDGSAQSEAAIPPAARIAAALSPGQPVTLQLVWAGPLALDANPPAREAALRDADTALRGISERAREAVRPLGPFTVTWVVLRQRDPWQAVAGVAEYGDAAEGVVAPAAFIALAPHMLRGFALAAENKPDDKLRDHTDLPLLIVPRELVRPHGEPVDVASE